MTAPKTAQPSAQSHFQPPTQPAIASLTAFGAEHIWHPYGPIPSPVAPKLVESAKGTDLHLANGRTFIDDMSSWQATCHNHSHPKLVTATQKWAIAIPYVMFDGLTHRPTIESAEKLLEPADPGFDVTLYSGLGSVSVEVAIKMALQYQQVIDHPERTHLTTWRGSCHDDTRTSMTVCGPEDSVHSPQTGQWTPQASIDKPPTRGVIEEERTHYFAHSDSFIDDSVAGIITESMVQRTGGMWFYDHGLLVGFRRLCDQHGILFIADEVATGFDRADGLFTTQVTGIVLDIMCASRALTGGFMSFTATPTTADATRIISSDAGGGIMYDPTFVGNLLTYAVVCTQLNLIAERRWHEGVPRTESRLREQLQPLAGSDAVADVHVLGAIGVVEMRHSADMGLATATAVDAGVQLRPFGKLVYTMPLYTNTNDEIDRTCEAIAAIVAVEEKHKQRCQQHNMATHQAAQSATQRHSRQHDNTPPKRSTDHHERHPCYRHRY